MVSLDVNNLMVALSIDDPYREKDLLIHASRTDARMDASFAELAGGTWTGTPGADIFRGDNTSEQLFGLDGNDTLSGGGGADLIDGGDGFDQAGYFRDAAVVASLKDPSLNKGAAKGDQYVSVEALTGSGTGNDVLRGDLGDNLLEGSGGNDTLFGDGGSDILRGAAGRDVLHGGAGGDFLIGRAGIDTASYFFDLPVTASLLDFGLNRGAARDDAYFEVENLEGSNRGGDKLYGDIAANGLWGRGGADTVSGAGGNDTICGGRDADVLNGQQGNDVYLYEGKFEGGDRIVSFASGDRFAFLGTAFGGLAAGALNAEIFVSHSSNAALDADDRFIFRTTDGTLWFDGNGSLSGSLFKIADLDGKYVLSVAAMMIT